MSHIFLDESGTFYEKANGEHFLVGSFTIGDPRRTEKAFKSWCHSRFPAKMRTLNEIKWSNTGINHELRLRTLKRIAGLDVRIRYVYLKKENIPGLYKFSGSEGEKLQSGLLYTNIIGEVIETYFPLNELEVFVMCDNRKLKGLTKMQFRDQLRSRLLPNLPKGTKLLIEMIDSTCNGNIQIADWIVGALATYHENQAHGDEYYEVLRNNLLDEGKELFAEERPY